MMNANRIPIRILGLDPGLRRTGWGVVSVEGSRMSHVAHGVIVPDEKADFASRLLHLFEGICAVIAEHRPDEAAVEEVFLNTNAQSTLKLGHARAAAPGCWWPNIRPAWSRRRWSAPGPPTRPRLAS